MPEQDNHSKQPPGWVGRAVFESLLIVVGIFVGFLVTEWREDLQVKKQGQAALARIIQEITTNRDAVARILPYHEKLAADLRTLLDNPPTKPLIDTFLQGVAQQGVGDLLLLDTAWRTAAARDSLATLDFLSVQRIADAYDLAKTGPQASWNMIVGFFTDTGMYAPDENGYLLRRLSFAYDTLAMQEKALLQRYNYTLQQLAPEGSE